MASAFPNKEVEQYTVRADNATLSCLYRELANKQEIPGPYDPQAASVNLAANIERYVKEDCISEAVFVPGATTFDLSTLDSLTQTTEDLARTEALLRKYCLDFKRKTVLYTLAGPVTGVVARAKSVLNAVKVQIFWFYGVENGASIYDVSNIDRASDALSATVAEQDALIETLPNCSRVNKKDCKNCKKDKKCHCKKDKHSHKKHHDSDSD